MESEEARMLLEQKELFEEAQKVFAEAVATAGQNYRKAGVQSSTGQVNKGDTNAKFQVRNDDESQQNQEGAVKYDERQKLDDIADRYENISNFEYPKDKTAHPLLLVMEETPQMLVELMKKDGIANVKNRKILIRKDALYLAIRNEGIEKGHYHNLGAETLKQLPQKIKDPDVVLKTNGAEKRRLLLTHINTGNGEAVISIEFEAPKDFEGKYDHFNIIITVFDLHKNYIKGLFNKHGAIVEYKKEDLAQVNPQLYEWLEIFNTRSSENNIPQPGEEVKYQLRDTEYIDAVNNNNLETAQKLVDKAAKEAGYDSPMLYHGTGAFGFTEFDLSKMDDKRSIFLTDSEKIASTYSGVEGKRKIGKKEKPTENLSIDELAEQLNKHPGESFMKFNYQSWNYEKQNKLIQDVNEGIDKLKSQVGKQISVYAEKLADDFAEGDYKTHKQLVKLKENLEKYEYNELSTPIYLLLHMTDVFNENAAEIAELERNIRLMNQFTEEAAKGNDEVIIESGLDGYSIELFTPEYAKIILDRNKGMGNYSLYADLGKTLEIDADGQVWNNVNWRAPRKIYNADDVFLESIDSYYILVDAKKDKAIPNSVINVNDYTENMTEKERIDFMLSKAQSSFEIEADEARTTRDVAKVAKKWGYDSVVFKGLKDNGGNNMNVDYDEKANIYIIFDPNRAKSADPVTYDDDGNVIHLSERFKKEKPDIRYSERDSAYEEWEVQTALYDALNHKDIADENLIRVGKMPNYVVNKFGIEGDFYIYRNHAYENIVSKEQAIADGRYRKKAHYHNFGIEKMTDAIMSIENPLITMSVKNEDGNPSVMMVLPISRNTDSLMYAVLSFYSNKPINGSFERKPHIVLTVAERDYDGSGRRAGWTEIINKAAREGRILDYDKKIRETVPVIAQTTSLGNIAKNSLKQNLAQFVQEVKAFKNENEINYQDRLPIEDRNRLSVLGGKKDRLSGYSSGQGISERRGLQDNLYIENQREYGRIPRPIDSSEQAGSDIARNSDDSSGYSSFELNDVKLQDRDSDGRELSKEQAEYFKDSKVRDENGKLLVMYHGTDAEFTEFSKEKTGGNTHNGGFYGRGFYFTEDKKTADKYAEFGKGSDKKTMSVYLDIKNPFYWNKIRTESDLRKFEKSIGFSEGFLEWTQGYAPYAINRFEDTKKAEAFSEALYDSGYDGIVFEYDSGFHEFVAFSPEQIKNIDNKNPTSNPDIRYSERDSYKEGLSEEDRKNAEEVIRGLRNTAMGARYGVGSTAAYTMERIAREISYSSGRSADYAKSYITWVEPVDFIYATTASEQNREQLKKEAGSLDIERLAKETQPIHLTVDFETGEIIGHEGRHRMLALQDAGIRKVAVIIDSRNDDVHHTKPVDMMKLKGQSFGEFRKGTGFYLHDMLPLSARYADVAKELFTQETDSGIRYDERDFKIKKDVEDLVHQAATGTTTTMHTVGKIDATLNKAINRLDNQSSKGGYRGKYEGGERLVSDAAIRHILSQHGDFLTEALRAQFPMTEKDIARHLSAIKDGKFPTKIEASNTSQGKASILTAYEINGYTLYAEEIKKPLGKNSPSGLMGHTMYKAPTLSTAPFGATSATNQPKRQSLVLCEYNSTQNGKLSTGNFVADSGEKPAKLKYIEINGSPKQVPRLLGLIALSSDDLNFTDNDGNVESGYVLCQKPFYITPENRVFSNSDSDVAQIIQDLKHKGYDCFIFDKSVGDNYMVAVFNKAQIIKQKPTVKENNLFQDRLPIEDRNRFSVLGGKKDRLSGELAVLEKGAAFAKADCRGCFFRHNPVSF